MKNKITKSEKDIILEMHTTEKSNKNFFNLAESEMKKLIMTVLSEQQVDTSEQNSHRYDRGEQSPGIEKFLSNPMDTKVENGLLNQLRNDPFGKGKIVIIFNGQKFKEPGSFIQKIQSDHKGGKCYEITNYEYNNRFILNTQIKITANGVECKKQEQPPIKVSGGTSDGGTKPTPKPTPKPKPKKSCKYKKNIPDELTRTYGDMIYTPMEQFQRYCDTRTDYWYAEYTDGTTRKCSKNDVDGKWGCCSQTCYEKLKKRDEQRRKIRPSM